jgi:hypothetical protein
VPVQNLKTKYGTNKNGTLPDWNPGSSNFIILKWKGRLLHDAKENSRTKHEK